jgi:hypothetical protein
MKDKKIRQALSMAIDRKKLIDTLWRGKTITPNGNQMEVFGEYYVKDFKGTPYDPAAAKMLLAESSYDGQEVPYRLIPNYYTNSMEAAQIIQEMWKQIGFNMKITPVENWKAVRAKGVAMYPWSNTFRYPEPIGQVNMSWGPGTAIQKKYKFWAGTKEYNDLAQLLTSSVDKGERKVAFRQEHARPARARHRAPDDGERPVRRAQHRRSGRPRMARPASAHADDLPGPGRRAGSAHERRRSNPRAARHPRPPYARRKGGHRRTDDRSRRPAARSVTTLSARIERGAATARRHRARSCSSRP